jgi:hypothetical protein
MVSSWVFPISSGSCCESASVRPLPSNPFQFIVYRPSHNSTQIGATFCQRRKVNLRKIIIIIIIIIINDEHVKLYSPELYFRHSL